jgi:hypothetical protein
MNPAQMLSNFSHRIAYGVRLDFRYHEPGRDARFSTICLIRICTLAWTYDWVLHTCLCLCTRIRYDESYYETRADVMRPSRNSRNNTNKQNKSDQGPRGKGLV